MKIKDDDLCPCNSGKKFSECCGPVVGGQAKAETAEALMRARYTAYAVGAVDFIRDSSVDAIRKEFDRGAAEAWSQQAEWHGLEVVKTELGGPDDKTGVVEFHAFYSARGESCDHHERSTFVRGKDGGWLFEDGEMLKNEPTVREEPKIGRNDPCPCGSGKKYKKCCGRGA